MNSPGVANRRKYCWCGCSGRHVSPATQGIDICVTVSSPGSRKNVASATGRQQQNTGQDCLKVILETNGKTGNDVPIISWCLCLAGNKGSEASHG